MKLIKLSKGKDLEELKHYTQEMKDWFLKRTNLHISLVQKYCKEIAKQFDEFEDLDYICEKHDADKFQEEQMLPYIWITWKYKCLEDGLNFQDYNPPKNLDKLTLEATERHVTNPKNVHHPECHSKKKDGLINPNERDGASGQIIDATSMPDIAIAEMCADWMSVSKEKGNSPQEWADKNIDKRWKFNKKQVDLIYKILNTIWEKS